MKRKVIDTINDLEIKTGIQESGVIVFHQIEPGCNGTPKTYTFEEIDGKTVYYKNGIPLTDKELRNLELSCLIIIDNIGIVK